MSTWVVTLQIEIPNDPECKANPETWDWFDLVNDEYALATDPDSIEVTVVKVQGVAA